MKNAKKNRRWSYRRKESSSTRGGASIRRIAHSILFDGKVISRSYGPDHTEGARCEEVVKRCNAEGVIHDDTIVGADIPSTTRTKVLHEKAEERRIREKEAARG